MSGLHSSLNGSASNLPDGLGRSFATSFSGQSGTPTSAFHHVGNIQGLHSIHGSYNVGNMPGTITSRNSSLSSIPSAGVHQPNGSISGGRYPANNLPVALSQLSHGSTHGHSGVTNRGGINVVGNSAFTSNANGVAGSIPGILPTSAAASNRSAVPALGVSQIWGNAGSRITNSLGNMVGGVNMGRNISSGGGLSIPGLASRLNLPSNSGSGLSIQGQNRIMGGVLPQGSPVMSMLGNSYPTGGPLSQNHVQSVNNLMLNDHSNDSSLFDINNDFPQLTSRPGSAGGPQGQIGSLRKQGIGVPPITQQNQEFSIQNEDFPALPGFKGTNTDYPMDLHQKEQLHDNAMSMMQSQHFSMGRSAGFNMGGTYSTHHPQQQQHTSSTGGPLGFGLRPLNSPNTVSSIGYDQLIQQYQQHQNQPQFWLQQMSSISQQFRDPDMKTPAAAQSEPDRYGLLGLLGIIKMSSPELTSLALGIDLTTLGLNLNSAENIHKTFASPWSNEPAKGDPEYSIPQCYYAVHPPPLRQAYFSKFSVDTLFYIFYSMPKDEAQLYAAYELYNRGWFYHNEQRLWFARMGEPLVKMPLYERGSYTCFDPNTFEIARKETFVVHYEFVEKRPMLPQH